jgi:hypothetical protein
MTTKLLQRTALIALTCAALLASPAPAAGAHSACASLGGTVDADQTCQVHSAASNYTLDMSFPLDYPDQQALTDYLTQDRDQFLSWIARFGTGARNRPYEHSVTAKSYGSASGTQSLVLKIQDDTGAAHEAHPDAHFQAFNYDLGKRAPITFDTLFKPDTDPLDTLNPIVLRELGSRPEVPVNDLNTHTYQNFAITDDAVIFFFGEDQVVNDNNGPHQVSVPRSELASLLA